ncbi:MULTISPECIES: hypothetical protein [unclassified Nocardioides]|uniref:hypothetical protein n=1 Tax=unclassified Nocardioides TaxID=2615069 RepID=UPI0009F0041E|nr:MULTISPECIES: hypothetical protein [unclassified Nocardioides]GAW47947.1 uncharacterized protein PD653B2_0258 [Nocardioides sp. PD653-B2]GAW53750.1 uncharacterized protein PD653_1153 [Nocardioides sp. PD653]
MSKLLLRHGTVYYGGHAWTGKHDGWLRGEALDQLTRRSSVAGLPPTCSINWARFAGCMDEQLLRQTNPGRWEPVSAALEN